jgi:DNA-binding IclR family transcriptional regulator
MISVQKNRKRLRPAWEYIKGKKDFTKQEFLKGTGLDKQTSDIMLKHLIEYGYLKYDGTYHY